MIRQTLLLEAALNGSCVHPHLPRTPEALAEAARASVQVGARVLHLHPYDETGRETLAAALWSQAARLSLGDRCCPALARRLDAPAVTADRDWRSLSLGVEIRPTR